MNKIFSLLLILGINVCFCSEMNKCYVNEDSVYIDNNQLFVEFEGRTIAVASIHSDSQGLYVSNDVLGYWQCSRGHWNPPWNLVCHYCKSSS